MSKAKLRVLALLLVACMVFAMAPAARAASSVEFTQVDASQLGNVARNELTQTEQAADIPADEAVRVIIILEEKSAVDQGYSTLGLAENPAALHYMDRLLENQEDALAEIETALGEELDVNYHFTIGINGFDATVAYGQIETIRQMEGVQEVYLQQQYTIMEDQPNTATAGEMVHSYNAWADGYTGAGSRIAIIDTGIDPDHPSFDEEAFQYGLALSAAKFDHTVADYDLLTAEDIAEVLPRLHVSERLASATANDLYYSEKIPFGFNYIMKSLEFACDASSGDHGCHVSGIAAANQYVPYRDEDGDMYFDTQENGVTGVAPNAQILAMKVFSDGWGAYDADYMAAIEDAILLGCDSVNLSLGSATAGRSYSSSYEELFQSLLESDTVVTMSAGNNGAWGDNNLSGTGLNLTTDVRMHSGGSPGSYTNSFTIASVDNTGLTGQVAFFNGATCAVNDTATQYGADPFPALDTSEDHTGTNYPYIFLGNPDTGKGVYGDEGDFDFQDLQGKIVLISRGGGVSFFEKANRAAAKGAAATVIYNNVDGSINMNLSGYLYTAPCVSITLADANAILAVSQPDDNGSYTGTATVADKVQTITDVPDGGKPSSFSSWGVPENLMLKPEITAPGGNIYSTLDNGTYGQNSGTSMSSPNVTGCAAVVAQYIKENKLQEKTGLTVRALAISLLMSTSKPITDKTVDLPYSPRLQGSGLAQVYEAVTSPAYLTTGQRTDGKVKMEFGDDPERTGLYADSFTIGNLTDQPISYKLSSYVATMATETIDGMEFMSKSAYELHPNVSFTTEGKVIYTYDVNGDGKMDEADALMLLQIANETLGQMTDSETAKYDFDADGVITTTDAQILLSALEGDTSYLQAMDCCYEVPASGKLQVNMTITLSQEDRAYLDTHYPNGGYVDGYIYLDSADGQQKQMSIPMLAFYGNWTDSSMFERTKLLEDEYKEDAWNYVTENPTNYLTIKLPGSSSAVVYASNMFANDNEYLADRNAMSSLGTLYQAVPTFIRNAEHSFYEISDVETGEVYFTYEAGLSTGAYYSTSSSAWMGTSSSNNLNYYMTAADGKTKLPEGTKLRLTVTSLPEYNWDREQKAIKGTPGKGTTWITEFTVDNTAPEATSIYAGSDYVGTNRNLRVSVRDNRYVAAVLLASESGQVLSRHAVNQTTAGVESTLELDLNQIYTNDFLVLVCDYAGNMSAYEVHMGGNIAIPELDTTLSAALQAEDGMRFVRFDADNPASYTSTHETAIETKLLAAAYGANGTLYTSSYETSESGTLFSTLYTADAATGTLTKVGTSEIGYTDLSFAPSVTENGAMIATYGPYAAVVNTTTGGYDGAWDLRSYIGNSNLAVALAYLETQPHDTYGSVDLFALLANDGTLYQTGFAWDAASSKYVIFTPTAIGTVDGMTQNAIAGSSMYAENGMLFISTMADNGSKILYVDLTASNLWFFHMGTMANVPVCIYDAEPAQTEGNRVNLPALGQAVTAQETPIAQIDCTDHLTR